MVTARAAASVLSRIRTSTRLAVLLLLIFGLKLGTAAACVGHDFADLGLGTVGEHASAWKASADSDGDPSPTATEHASNCTHGSCHQVADVALSPSGFMPVIRPALEVGVDGRPPSLTLQSQLRPPIV
ncbi:MAG: hypothetical protein ACREO7_13460 [Pseudoxanthomonas sp.]